MDSADVEAPTTTRRSPLRTVARWLPAAVLAIVSVAAGTVAVGLDGPPTGTPGPPTDRSDTPVLSLRRTLGPLGDAAADHALRADLDDVVATLPDDTCLDVTVDSVRFDHRTDDGQSPASLQKLVIAVAALTELGPEETFETEVLGAPAVDGIVNGNLYVRGGGDPILANPEYAARERNQPQIYSDVNQVVQAVRDAGIIAVTGSVVGDESRYDAVRYNPAMPTRFIAQGQVGPLSALSLNDGFAYLPGVPGVFGPAPDPAAYAATMIDGALRASGVLIGGPPASGVAPAEAEVLATHRSPPLERIITQMLSESDNNTAELLLKEIGLQSAGKGTFEAGRSAVLAILADAGIDVEGLVVVDGSGLSTDNVLTCDHVVELLGHPPTADDVRDGLAVAGQSGTLSRRWAGTGLEGKVRAKTGTLNTVTGLAGFAETGPGAEEGSATFALLVNLPDGVITAEIIAVQQRLAEALVAYPDVPALDGLRPGGTGPG